MNFILKNIYCHAPWLLSDKSFVEKYWYLRTGKKLDLSSPRTFNEKIQWLKVYDQKKEYFQMVDKYEAKKFVSKIIGEEHIIPTIAVYDNVSRINWESLPESFVIKCTHDSGGLAICRDKNNIDREQIEKKLSKCLKTNFFYRSREWCYKGIKPRIICEKLMQDNNQKNGLIDYKFFCFNGQPQFLYISSGLEDHSTAAISFADLGGKRLPFKRSDYREIDDPLPIPPSFEKMKSIAERLAQAVNNSFIRVDLYDISGCVYFSELTFYPNSGFIPFSPEEWDLKLGDLLTLPL